MLSGIHSALLGMQAFAAKVEKNANNIANMNTEGFKKDRVILSAQTPQGVRADVEQDEVPGPWIDEPTEQGMVAREGSNVDLTKEIPDLMLNVHGYTANLKTVQSVDEMLQSVLDIQA
jgi:flagellar basal-body rod protein FlgC